MTDSKLSKDILAIIEDAGPHIDVAAATVGLLTEYVKLINEKVPLKDLLMEVGKFVKSEAVPAIEALDAEMFRQRESTAKRWAKVYKAIAEELNHLDTGGVTLAMTLQLMKTSEESMARYAKSVSDGISKSKS